MRTAIAFGLLAVSAALSLGAKATLGTEGGAGYAGMAARLSPRAEQPDVSALVRRAEILSLGLDQASEAIEKRNDRLLSTPSILPAAGTLSSAFARARWHPVLNETRPHNGLDIRAPRGSAIRATAKGRVRFAGWNAGYGLSVEVDHGYGYVTRYAHASRLTVKVGEKVARGQKIGEVGATGLAEAPHVHYEVLVNGKPANPRRFIYDGRSAD